MTQTGNLARRLHVLEVASEGLQQTMTFVWGEAKDDPALRAAQADAERRGKLLVIIRKFSNPGSFPQEAHL